jgi:hypothetical protein
MGCPCEITIQVLRHGIGQYLFGRQLANQSSKFQRGLEAANHHLAKYFRPRVPQVRQGENPKSLK